MGLSPKITLAVRLLAVVAVVPAAGLTACSGLDAGIDYPSDLPSDLGPHLLTPENQRDPPIAFNLMKIAPQACDKIDTHAVASPLNQEDFSRFLEGQGLKIEPRKARDNLYWYDFPNGDPAPKNFVRLRLAVLGDTAHAAADLHQSILEHGPGWWGVRRSNLAVLGPIGNVDQIMEFAGRTKLACWGVLTVGGRDDDFVIPGGYMEF